MPFRIIRNDITRVEADAIVNTANPRPVIGSGTDRAIYQAAGADALLEERKKIGDIPVGKAAATSAFALKARYIIHTVGPAWVDGAHGEGEALRSCYEESLKLAEHLRCESIAFPLLATGNYDFPRDLAIRAATDVIYAYLMDHDMTVCLVVFDRESYDLSGKIFRDINAYIDENYVAEQTAEEYAESRHGISIDRIRGRRRREPDAPMSSARPEPELQTRPSCVDADAAPAAPYDQPLASSASYAGSLGDYLNRTDISFRDYLMQLIIERDMKNADVYRGANISKQHFSKIISNENYHPSKNTICALALSLHLDLTEAEALLEKAGLVLSQSSRFDLAVKYFILHKMYNVIDNNIILDENELDLLGTQ